LQQDLEAFKDVNNEIIGIGMSLLSIFRFGFGGGDMDVRPTTVEEGAPRYDR
jgi:hypothetical protein